MKLQDFQVSKCSPHVHIPFAASWSQDNVISMATDMGVYLMEMTPSPFNKSPTLDIHRYIVFPSDYNPTSDSGIDVDELMRVLPEEELYEVVQDIAIAPHIKGSRYSPTVKYVAWSPMKITHNMRALLTILTDSGGLDIYCLSNNNWKHILSISNQWQSHCKSEWDRNFEQNVTRSEILKLLKQRTYKIKITAFAWGEVHVGPIIWCPLFAGTKDGMILVWKINQVSTTVNAELVSLMETHLGQITSLNCELVNQAHYLVFCAALNGRIQTHVVCLLDKAESAAFVGQTYETWPDEDRIEVPGGGMVSASWPSRVILAAAKGPHLLLLLNTDQGAVITNCIVNSNNLAITGVSFITPENLLMTTTEGTVYLVNVRQDYNGFLETHFSTIESSIQFENYRCNGFAMSNSNAIMCLAFSVQGNYDHLQLREYSQAVWCTVKDLDDAIAAINNHIGSLYDIWDIFELVRIQWLKKNMTEKVFTVHNTEELDVMDVNKLKKNLWFVEISLKLDSLPNDTKKSLESLKDEMTTLIMSSHVFKRVTQLISNSGEEITQLDAQSLRIMRHWLYYLVNIGLKTSYTATHATASTLLQQIDDSINDADKITELCSICRARVESVEDISTAICAQGHSIPRCILSMVQCAVIRYYICPICKIIAHPSAVAPTRCTCVFCDHYLRVDEKINPEESVDKEDTFYL